MQEQILNQFLTAYNIDSKNTENLSVKHFDDLLKKHQIIGKYPPDFALMTIIDNSIECKNIDRIRLGIRAKLYENYFQKIIDNYSIFFNNGTTFIVDLSDGCQNRNFLFELDKICVAPSVPNINPIHSLPISDPHYLHKNYQHYYDGTVELSDLSWRDKNNTFLYRGTVRPTLRPDANSGSTWITPRLDFCKKYSNTDRCDIGFPRLQNTDVWVKEYEQYFKNKMSKIEMSSYRYNILISGIGANFEALIWLLLSNTTILRLCSNDNNILMNNYPYWLLWFDSLLEPYKHYVPFNMDNFEDILFWCENNIDLCEQISNNAKIIHNTIISSWDYYNMSVLNLISKKSYE